MPEPNCTGPSCPGACYHTSPLLLTKHLFLWGLWSSQPCWASTGPASLTSLAIANLQDSSLWVSPGRSSTGPRRDKTKPLLFRCKRWLQAGQSVAQLTRPMDTGLDAAPFCNYLYTLCIILRLLVRMDGTAAQAPTRDGSTTRRGLSVLV